MTNPTDNQTPQPVDEMDDFLYDFFPITEREISSPSGDIISVDANYKIRQEAKARLLQWKNKAVDGRRLQKDEVYEIGKSSSFKGTILADDEPVVVMSKSTFLQWGTRQVIKELRRIDEFQQMGTLTKNQDGKPEWVNRRIAELQASLKDGGNDE